MPQPATPPPSAMDVGVRGKLTKGGRDLGRYPPLGLTKYASGKDAWVILSSEVALPPSSSLRGGGSLGSAPKSKAGFGCVRPPPGCPPGSSSIAPEEGRGF